MVSLCSNCMKNDPPMYSIEGSNSRCLKPNEDPIFKALVNLQTKIKLLEFQRNEASVRLDESKDFDSTINDKIERVFVDNGFTNNHNSREEAKIDFQYKDSNTKDVTKINYSLEKHLANEALKLAEEKCENLENQLQAMKKIFLEKIVGRRDCKVVEDFEKLTFSLFNCKNKESTESDSEILLPKKKTVNNKRMWKRKRCFKIDFPNKIDNMKSDKGLCSKTDKSNKTDIKNYPFILGCSTSTSHNSAVKSQINRQNKIQDLSVRNKMSFNFDMNHLKNVSAKNLRTMYFSLCDDYDKLFNKKITIIDSINDFNGEEFQIQKEKLNEITESLFLKKNQIQKIKTIMKNHNMFNNSNDDSNINSNLTWDI